MKNKPAKRFQTNQEVKVEIYGHPLDIKAKMKNLSSTGAFLELMKAETLPQQGDLIRITVPLLEVNKVRQLSAEVIWNQGLGFGINFISDELVVDKIMLKSI